ncbi:MAG TPA: hypothetical protein VIY47_16020 [Ignavibacteriaceae bacterium]
MSDDEAMVRLIFLSYLEDWDPSLLRLKKAVADKDASSVRREAHSLKSIVSAIGDEEFSLLFRSIEMDAMTGVFPNENEFERMNDMFFQTKKFILEVYPDLLSGK